MLPPQPPAELRWEFLVALLANRLQIAFVEFGFLIHLLVTNRAGKVMNAPRFIQRSENCNYGLNYDSNLF